MRDEGGSDEREKAVSSKSVDAHCLLLSAFSLSSLIPAFQATVISSERYTS
jgi:hypothetical protein